MGGGVPGLPWMVAGVPIEALSLDDDEMKAADPARNGISAFMGFAVAVLAAVRRQLWRGVDAPRRAIEAADLVVDNILATGTRNRRAVKEWRGSNAGWRMSKSSGHLMRSRKFGSWRIFD